MHCKNCNTLNNDEANFCYSCGKKIVTKKNNFSFKSFIYKNVILSKNRYRNVFILLSTLVTCSALSVPLCQGVSESFNIAMDLVNMSKSQQIAKYALKNQTELFFRDAFLRVLLILFFAILIILDIFILIYSYVLRKQKEKNIY